MRLKQDILQTLHSVANTARLLGIAEISMEENAIGKMFRGMSDTGGTPVVLNQSIDFDLPFASLAIRDTNSFIQKYDLAVERGGDLCEAHVDIDQNRKAVSSIQFRGNKFKLNFIAGSAEAVRAPKRLKDPFKHSFSITEDDIKTLKKATKAMGGDFVTFVYDGSSLTFEVKASKTDIFSYTFCEKVVNLGGGAPTFAFAYPIKTLTTMLDNSDDNLTFQIGEKGIINGVMGGVNVFLFPRI